MAKRELNFYCKLNQNYSVPSVLPFSILSRFFIFGKILLLQSIFDFLLMFEWRFLSTMKHYLHRTLDFFFLFSVFFLLCVVYLIHPNHQQQQQKFINQMFTFWILKKILFFCFVFKKKELFSTKRNERKKRREWPEKKQSWEFLKSTDLHKSSIFLRVRAFRVHERNFRSQFQRISRFFSLFIPISLIRRELEIVWFKLDIIRNNEVDSIDDLNILWLAVFYSQKKKNFSFHWRQSH